MVSGTINGVSVSVPEGTTILSAAESAGIWIPRLCYLKDINEIGACRVCVVEVEGQERLAAACNTEFLDGMAVHTDSARVRRSRKTTVQLILSQHRTDCPVCVRNENCSLQTLATDLGVTVQPYQTEYEEKKWDDSFPILRDASKCIKCMRCVSICEKVQTLGVWDVAGTGGRTTGEPSDPQCRLRGRRPVRDPLPGGSSVRAAGY